MRVTGDVVAEVFAALGMPAEARGVRVVNDNGVELFTLSRAELAELVMGCVSAALALRSSLPVGDS